MSDYQIRAVISEGHGLRELPGATIHRQRAQTARVERLLWYLSIAVFTLALIAFAISLLAASLAWSIFFGVLVVGAQLSGYLFVNRIPNAQLDRFRTGLEQGDIVLQVDVPLRDAKLVRSFVNNRFPESHTNISNLHIGSFEL